MTKYLVVNSLSFPPEVKGVWVLFFNSIYFKENHFFFFCPVWPVYITCLYCLSYQSEAQRCYWFQLLLINSEFKYLLKQQSTVPPLGAANSPNRVFHNLCVFHFISSEETPPAQTEHTPSVRNRNVFNFPVAAAPFWLSHQQSHASFWIFPTLQCKKPARVFFSKFLSFICEPSLDSHPTVSKFQVCFSVFSQVNLCFPAETELLHSETFRNTEQISTTQQILIHSSSKPA